MNSDTLQYLVDAYIASDNNQEGFEYSNTKSPQTAGTISQQSTEINAMSVSAVSKEGTSDSKELNNGKDCTFLRRDDDDKKIKINENAELKERSNDIWETSQIPEQIWKESREPRRDMQVTQVEYARDPSPTKAPRKRFLPPRLRGREQLIRDEGLQARQTNLSADLIETTRDPYYSQNVIANQESQPLHILQRQQKETEKHTTLGEDNGPCSEDLPTWYTYNGSLKTDYFNATDGRQNDITDNQRMYERKSDSGNVQHQPGIPAAHCFVKTDCTKDDDIANDPCVVQYWTQPNRPSLGNDVQFQAQADTFESSNVYMPANAKPRQEQRVGSTEIQNCNAKDTKDTNRSSCAPTNIAPERPGKSGNQTQRKTAIVKPISKQWKHARYSVNSALGQSILENAMRIDTTRDEVIYPSDLRGSPEPPETEERGPNYFPRFHE
ncbi:MAG: hypothetical protein AB2693_29610, partial [Candidatus Thiodiazotropha sp.]